MKFGSISSRNNLKTRSVVSDVDDDEEELNETERNVRTQFSTSPRGKEKLPKYVFAESEVKDLSHQFIRIIFSKSDVGVPFQTRSMDPSSSCIPCKKNIERIIFLIFTGYIQF